MKLSIPFLLLILFSYSGCLVGDTDCCKYIRTDKIAHKLYIEKYQTFCGGVFGERIDHYITDSTSFRSNVGWNDEHNFLSISLHNDSAFVYKIESVSTTDTLSQKSLPINDLFRFRDMKSATTMSHPLFGINTLTCNDSYFFSSSEVGNKYFLSSDQFKCGNTFINADYLTDTTNFHLLIGFYDVGSGPFYSVKIDKDSVHFYQKKYGNRTDTIEEKKFKISDLRKEGLVKVCNK